LVDDQFGVTISFKVPYPHLLSELEAYKQGIVLGYVVGARFCQWDYTRKDMILRWDKYHPHSGDNLALWACSYALSKNISHTPSPEVMLASMTSSGITSCSFEVSETGWAAKKSARVWPLIAFWGYEGHVILGQQYGSKLANLKFRKPDFVMRIRRGLNLEMTWMVCLTK